MSQPLSAGENPIHLFLYNTFGFARLEEMLNLPHPEYADARKVLERTIIGTFKPNKLGLPYVPEIMNTEQARIAHQPYDKLT